eukprot:scaffold160355_cov20-Prasinocladus_malaysianus.AAC.3
MAIYNQLLVVSTFERGSKCSSFIAWSEIFTFRDRMSNEILTSHHSRVSPRGPGNWHNPSGCDPSRPLTTSHSASIHQSRDNSKELVGEWNSDRLPKLQVTVRSRELRGSHSSN